MHFTRKRLPSPLTREGAGGGGVGPVRLSPIPTFPARGVKGCYLPLLAIRAEGEHTLRHLA
jgi:hypothetical protein